MLLFRHKTINNAILPLEVVLLALAITQAVVVEIIFQGVGDVAGDHRTVNCAEQMGTMPLIAQNCPTMLKENLKLMTTFPIPFKISAT